MTKPFETPELLACLRAITRRGDELKPEEIGYEDFSVSLATSELICKSRSVRLGAKELELIRLLIANKGVLLSKETIYLKIWGYNSEAEDNIVEVYISFLRKKNWSTLARKQKFRWWENDSKITPKISFNCYVGPGNHIVSNFLCHAFHNAKE